jgi:hypothetical protein
MQPEEDINKATPSARDNMTRLYEWITVWEKHVKQEKRQHEDNDTGRKTRKRV